MNTKVLCKNFFFWSLPLTRILIYFWQLLDRRDFSIWLGWLLWIGVLRDSSYGKRFLWIFQDNCTAILEKISPVFGFCFIKWFTNILFGITSGYHANKKILHFFQRPVRKHSCKGMAVCRISIWIFMCVREKDRNEEKKQCNLL